MADETAKVLLIEDNPGDARLIKEMLADAKDQPLDMNFCDCLSSALEYLTGNEPDLILLDLGLPDSQGLNTLTSIYSQAAQIPVVVLTGLDDEELALKALHEGAQDYLVKGQFDTALLVRSIRYAAGRKQVEEEKRKLDRMKSEFISQISHELRTPLHSIQGFTRVLLRGDAPDIGAQREFLGIIEKQSRKLEELITNLLDMSRLESSRFQIRKRLIPMKDVIRHAIDTFHTLANDKGIVINDDIPATLPEMYIDEERLEQVIANLLSNAIKFSNNSNTITVKAKVEDGNLIVQVADRGFGIPEEAMPHLFERFYRVRDTAWIGGAGLGLYISQQIVEAHGGQISVESKVDEGSTFSFTLPLDCAGGNSHE